MHATMISLMQSYVLSVHDKNYN